MSVFRTVGVLSGVVVPLPSYPFLFLHDNVVLGLGNGCRHQLVSAGPWMHREACPTLSSVCHSQSVVLAPPRTPLPCWNLYCWVFVAFSCIVVLPLPVPRVLRTLGRCVPQPELKEPVEAEQVCAGMC